MGRAEKLLLIGGTLAGLDITLASGVQTGQSCIWRERMDYEEGS